MVINLDIGLLDVEKLFQNGNLDKEIYIELIEVIEQVMDIDRRNKCMK